MRKLFYLLAIAALMAVFVACEKKELLCHTQTDSSVARNVISENDIQSLLAANLLKSINEGNPLIENLTELSNKKFDMDYDVLGVPFLKSINESRTRSSLSSFVNEDLLALIEKNYPLLNFYVPFSADDFKKSDDYLVVIWPENGNDKEGYMVKAFNKNGESLQLSSREEPSIPYIVIGENERVDITSNKTTQTRNTDLSDGVTIYKSSQYTYILPIQYNHKFSDNNLLSEFRATNKFRNPKAKGVYEVITSARFTSLKAIAEVEGWGKGKPEVHVTAAYYKVPSKVLDNRVIDLLKNIVKDDKAVIDGLLKFKNDILLGSITQNMGRSGWFNGSRWFLNRKVATVYGNWNLFRWNEEALPVAVKYKFVELDRGYKLPTISYKGFSISYEIGAKTDDIGEETVYYTDQLGTEYRVGNLFNFIINQK